MNVASLKHRTCAIYVRYSGEDDDEDKKGTRSIQNQIEFLTNYALEKEMIIENIYDDYFKTGTNMDRHGIKKLLNNMKLGKFNTIIVKDLSRFSRNYLDAGYYFDEVFPKYNIRFISVNENYDSFIEDETLPIRNYMNTMYSKDIKNKIHRYFNDISDKKEIIKIPKYGYNKDQNSNLQIDPYSANIVRQIFDKARKGLNPPAIAKELNNSKIYGPHYYKQFILGIKTNKSTKQIIDNPCSWNATQIRNILRDIEYCGDGLNIVSKNAKAKNKQVILEDSHPAIITKEEFAMTPKYYDKEKKPRQREYLNKIIRCNECNLAYAYTDSGKYYCPKCHNKIDANFIETILFQDTKNFLTSIIKDKNKVLKELIERFCTNDLIILEEQKLKLLSQIRDLLPYKSIISETEYNMKLKDLNNQITSINNNITKSKSKTTTKEELICKFNTFIENLSISQNDKLNLIKKSISSCTINKIENNNIELDIKYYFND